MKVDFNWESQKQTRGFGRSYHWRRQNQKLKLIEMHRQRNDVENNCKSIAEEMLLHIYCRNWEGSIVGDRLFRCHSRNEKSLVPVGSCQFIHRVLPLAPNHNEVMWNRITTDLRANIILEVKSLCTFRTLSFPQTAFAITSTIVAKCFIVNCRFI